MFNRKFKKRSDEFFEDLERQIKHSKRSKEPEKYMVIYSDNYREPFNLTGKIVREDMYSVFIEDIETGKIVKRSIAEYKEL